jgi:hypothetical protein
MADLRKSDADKRRGGGVVVDLAIFYGNAAELGLDKIAD